MRSCRLVWSLVAPRRATCYPVLPQIQTDRMPDKRSPPLPKPSADQATLDVIQAQLTDARDAIALLLRGSLSTAQREPLQAARRALQELPALLETLEGQNVGEHLPADAVSTQFSLRDRLSHLFQTCLAAALERGALLRLEIDPDVPDALAGDADLLMQTLRAALEHAVRHSAAGEIVLQVEADFLTQSQASIALSLHQAQGAPSSLAIHLVRSLGGRVIDEGQADGRFGFSCRFGLGQAVDKPIAAPRVATLIGMRVLLVFGSAADRAEIASVVRQWHLQPVEADSGDMAVALLDRARLEGQPILLALLGNPIHGEDGFLLALRIKRDSHLAQTLLFMLAAQGRPGDAGRCQANGVTGYLPLPINPADLSAALTAITGATASGAETPTLVTRHSLRESRHGASLLLVNAIPAEQLLLNHFLADTDFAITVVASGEEALRAARAQRFDVVLFDAQLPDIDGLALARALRDIDRLAGGDALLFALSADVTFKRHAVAAGIGAVLARPISKAALMKALSKS